MHQEYHPSPKNEGFADHLSGALKTDGNRYSHQEIKHTSSFAN